MLHDRHSQAPTDIRVFPKFPEERDSELMDPRNSAAGENSQLLATSQQQNLLTFSVHVPLMVFLYKVFGTFLLKNITFLSEMNNLHLK